MFQGCEIFGVWCGCLACEVKYGSEDCKKFRKANKGKIIKSSKPSSLIRPVDVIGSGDGVSEAVGEETTKQKTCRTCNNFPPAGSIREGKCVSKCKVKGEWLEPDTMACQDYGPRSQPLTRKGGVKNCPKCRKDGLFVPRGTSGIIRCSDCKAIYKLIEGDGVTKSIGGVQDDE